MLISAMYKYLIEGCSMGGHSSRFRRQGTDSMPWLSSPANTVKEIRDLRFRTIGCHHNTENPGIPLPDNVNKMTIRRAVLRIIRPKYPTTFKITYMNTAGRRNIPGRADNTGN